MFRDPFSHKRRWATSGALILALFILTTLLVLAVAPPAMAAPKATTRYVSPSGADSGNCSNSGSPCKTITYALTQVAAGDTINLAAGTYSAASNGETLPFVPTVDMTIIGAGATSTFIDGGSTTRGMTVNSGLNVTLQNVTIQNGNGLSCGIYTCGGGVQNSGTLTVTNSTFFTNTASTGGGILNNGTLIVTTSTFSGNGYSQSGGGIFNNASLTVANSTFSGNSAYSGAGITNYTSGIANITNSTFSSNSGSGIDNENALTVSNSTFAGNSAQTGGGIFNGTTLTVTNSTFSGNSASGLGGGGIMNYSGAILNYSNTIIANSPAGGDCLNYSGGIIATNTNNLVKDGSCLATLTGDPLLGPLVNNGGATQTMALLPGSPAINAGNDATCAASPVSGKDQRSVMRPIGAHCDIGAYEAPLWLFLPLIVR